MINIFEPSVSRDDMNCLEKVFESKWIGSGPEVSGFKKELAEDFGVSEERCLLTNSCSAGLMVLPYLFDIGKGDSVVMPTISFPSLANSFYRVGVDIRFTDLDEKTGNVRLKDIVDEIDETTKAVIVTHYGGTPVDLDPILDYCKERNIYVIEDAACAIKSFYKDKRVGTFSDCALWSLDAMKTLTTGDGGFMILRDKKLKERASELLYLGLPAQEKTGLDKSENSDQMWWEYDVTCAGSRDVLNDIAASIGRHQLSRLDKYMARRKVISECYIKRLQGVGDLGFLGKDCWNKETSNYFFTITSSKRDDLARYMKEKGIYTTFRYWPLHKTSLYKSDPVLFPNAEYLSSSALNIPVHQNLSDSDVGFIVNTITNFFSK